MRIDKVSRSTWMVIASIALATALKVYCAATTWGTNDTGLFQMYGHALYEAGLQATYEASPYYNHTPALSVVLMGLYWLSSTFSLYFPLLLRLPGILADVVTVLVLWRLVSKHLENKISVVWVCLFALNPISFMVSGYHGNFDSVLAMFVFLAAYECYRGNVELSALFYALAVHTKIAPLILSPIFFFYWLHRGKGLRFFIITNALLMAVWLVPLIEFPRVFIHNVFEYGSYWGIWGITMWMCELKNPQMHYVAFFGLYPIQNQIMTALKALVVLGILLMAWQRSKAEKATAIFESISYGWAIFFVFAPGVLLHYLCWPACTMLVHSRKWWLVIMTASSIFLFRCYTVINHGFPWDKGLFMASLLNKWRIWSDIPWLAYIAFLSYAVWQAVRARSNNVVDPVVPELAVANSGPTTASPLF